jgi:hypothetical protein
MIKLEKPLGVIWLKLSTACSEISPLHLVNNKELLKIAHTVNISTQSLHQV